MKKLFLLSLLGLFMLTLSCGDDCTQEAYCQLVSSQDYGKTTHDKDYPDEWYDYQCGKDDKDHEIKISMCTGKETECVDIEDVQKKLNKGWTVGECGTLSSHGLEFKDGQVVEIPCSYELPFIHTTSNGTQWYYTTPGNR